MSYEPGGRADKYGNEYENQYLARLLLRVVNGQYKSIIVEPLGENQNSVEFIVTDQGNNKLYFQCKGSNTNQSHWRICDLKRYDVFKRSKQIIQNSEKNQYFFISPLDYKGLDELCNRARTNSSVGEFLNYQLNSQKIKTLFLDCAKEFDLNTKDENQVKELIYILSKCHFEKSFSGIENINDLNEHVGMYFMGNADSARLSLQNFIISERDFGVPITANDIVSFMEKHDFPTRNNYHSENTLFKINELNELFYSSFKPINNSLIHRSETDQIYADLKLGKSVILHGKAGVGKSGCVQELINLLKEDNILYLALKLDKYPPEISADAYGNKIGLPQSPVYCLHNISSGKPCVLILDQLDSLRWTNYHNSTALEVCKALIMQADSINKHDNGQISIVLISRTFDLENDAGLKSLLSNQESNKISWNKIQVNLLTSSDAKSVVGDVFETLPPKLQKILQTPSSLYIWNSLDENSKTLSISTAFQLMDRWWCQIQRNCQSMGLTETQIADTKNLIVKKMISSSVFTLPENIFTDSKNELDALISNGLLINNNHKISFTHQSFLEYFAVLNMQSKVYDKKSITDIIGELNEQTPNLRNRMSLLLQNLLYDSEDLFIKISHDILNSNDIRYYFKCTVFEVIGQSETPSQKLLDFAYYCFSNPQWHTYVFNSIYIGHPRFIEDLDNRNSFDWLSNEGLRLLQSANVIMPNFVISKIKPICFKDKKNDKTAYSVLCHDCSQDSSEMFELRLKLFRSTPELLSNFWGMPRLFSSDSLNAISILKLIIELNDKVKDNLFLDDEKHLEEYSKKHYQELIKELLPLVCDYTKQFNCQESSCIYSKEYRKWINESYNDNVVRNIIVMLKTSMAEFSIKHPNNFLEFISQFDSKKSILYREIVAAGLYNLDISFSDSVIVWLYEDPTNNFFVYTDNQNDYLFTTKELLNKFSSHCSKSLFNKIESIILFWKDPLEKMVKRYKRRIEVNSENAYEPVYYSFWGHIQKELLPCLDNSRLCKKSKDLISVLNRNKWIRVPFYNCGFFGGPAKSVVSPLYNKTDRISDKKWLEIISTPQEKMKNYFTGKSTDKYYIEASHETFSSSLSYQAKQNPERFAKLSLQFPNDCYFGYISSVINALYSYNDNIAKPNFEITCSVITKYMYCDNHYIIQEILRLIKNRSEESWSSEIIDFVIHSANESTDPLPDEYSLCDNKDINSASPFSLLNNSINHVRGCAIETISALLQSHSEFCEVFKPVIEKACCDKNIAVCFSVMHCVFQYYDLDSSFAIKTFKFLIEKDIRALAFPNTWQIIRRDYNYNSEFYKSNLLKACDSSITELQETAAELLCAISIFIDNNLIDNLFEKDFDESVINKICSQAASSFNQGDYHSASKKILLNYINKNYEIHSFSYLFYNNCIDMSRDEEFLIQLVESNQKPYQMYTFLEYLQKQDQDISNFANVLKAISEKTCLENSWIDYAELLSKCIFKILDKCSYNIELKALCLDMWDNLYKNYFLGLTTIANLF